MHGLFIYISNYLERLSAQLAEVVAAPLKNPIAPEIIVVHSKGMERWVSMELARHNGICANVAYPFPNALMQRLFEIILPSVKTSSFFEPEVMTFTLMKHLRACAGQEGFGEITAYLADDAFDLKLFQLAEKLAQTFDQYVLFRPDLIFRWENGEENHWQAGLWRMISSGNEKMHLAGLRKQFLETLYSGSGAWTLLPQRVSVFGTSYLPPFHLKVLEALSKRIEIHFFVMNPCREYWSDILSEKQALKIQRQYAGVEFSDRDLFLERGNPLLASLGALGRDFFKTMGDLEGEETEWFCDPSPDCILGLIQTDILKLIDRTKTSATTLPNAGEGHGYVGKVHISIHSCHGPMREIEVLHDQLLAMMEEDPDLVPNDVVVMTPDIDAYAPFIKAVFETQTDPRLRIPFSIADQSTHGGHPVISCFWSILELADSRVDVPEVMGILESYGVKEKFGIEDAEIPIISQWLQGTRIRWGIDAAHREKIGLPGLGENTWKAGTDRLLMGYAMAGDQTTLFADILPYDSIEGSDAELLGKFLEFKSRLFEMADRLNGKKAATKWVVLLREMLDGFFLFDENSEIERQILGGALDRMANALEVSGFDEDIDLMAVKGWLKNFLAREKTGGGFISRGVTFCAMLPFRSIPAKIICLIGMNGDAFPREHHPAGFDLMAAEPRPGDRNRRDDDKYLFLQALLSARNKFYISYVGQSNRDNTRIPPSVVVNDLLDYIVKGFHIPENSVVTTHRLQPFSEGYFDGSGPLFSYSKEDYAACLAARDRLEKGPEEREFLDQSLSSPDPAFKSVDIEELGLFFSNPCKYLLTRRLGVYLDDEFWNFDQREVFAPDGLSQYQIGQDLVSKQFRGMDFKQQFAIEKATGRIPHGTMGEVFFSEMAADAVDFNEKVDACQTGAPHDPMDIRLDIDAFTLTGVLSGIYEKEMLQTAYVNIKPKYLIRTWIRHLVLCAMETPVLPQCTLLVGKDATWVFSAVRQSRRILSELLSLYWSGLMEPMAFFADASFAYADRLFTAGKPESDALRAALEKWRGNDFSPGESEDPYYTLCFPRKRFERMVEKGIFQETAVRICRPLLEHCRKIRD